MDWELFTGAIITSVFFIFFGWIWMRFPPRKINHLYGYRTRRSMSNQEIWNFANVIGAKMSLFLGIVLFFIGVLSYFLFPTKSPIISMVAALIVISIGLFCCETLINRHFDHNGNSKGKP